MNQIDLLQFGFRPEESASNLQTHFYTAKNRSLKTGADCPVCAHLRKLAQEPGRSRYDIIKESTQNESR